jgi:hypothetical protein
MELHDDFMKYVTGEKEIPEKFLKEDPDRRFANSPEIYELYEKYKKGPIPIDPVMVVPSDTIFIQPVPHK